LLAAVELVVGRPTTLKRSITADEKARELGVELAADDPRRCVERGGRRGVGDRAADP